MSTTLTALLFSSRYQKQRYLCAFILYLLIVIIGSIPGARKDIGDYASGIVLHTLAYAIIAYLLFSGTPGSLPRRAATSIVTVALMGALDEYIQSFLPYRRGAVSDWLVDCNAAILMSLLLWLVWPKAQRLVKE
ncbi:VanZ family protein [Janthinobacterium agaricidamnosum]|uniref:Putative membrane protein n=1 Tax=Janthinobacterium agaricidamnosum NBRC 102515 = DSM 9628 TaxID=1349767 RepID=W0VAC3_9BURK|nr:VanZ family protein [Janthinobacterium agaricidamnosum]CDG84836.1 putative membrane protein [Janthinobacterium agaricidamnosum NBRC 102515 = DSM 9628]